MAVSHPLAELNPKQHVPLEEYAANLKSMVHYLSSVGITEDRVLLITPPPLGEAAWEKACLAKGKGMGWAGRLCSLLPETQSLVPGWPGEQLHDVWRRL